MEGKEILPQAGRHGRAGHFRILTFGGYQKNISCTPAAVRIPARRKLVAAWPRSNLTVTAKNFLQRSRGYEASGRV
jgi:hypothetical protein